MAAPTIRKLDELVINRIAAGEVVQKPSSALKELLENSLDANATNIVVTVKGGGLQLLQIQDNGHGIRKEDLPILCERFTTSKLQTFDDLKSIQTYGFRGEALSSITHVSNVTITTKTANSQCAYKAVYTDGKVKVDPKPIAGTTGTTISVEDLFHNMPTRRQAFKNITEQYNKILDVVIKYSIHHGDRRINFTCKRVGQMSPDYQTLSNSLSCLDNIRSAYGASLAKEILDVSCNFPISLPESLNFFPNQPSEVNISGKISNANFSTKKLILLLFINGRLIESQSIRKVIDTVYSPLLPKQSFPFVYLSFTMPPQILDVNIHPTKKEVKFLFEDIILLELHKMLSSKLSVSNNSRIFYTQTLLSANEGALVFDDVRIPRGSDVFTDLNDRSSQEKLESSSQNNINCNDIALCDSSTEENELSSPKVNISKKRRRRTSDNEDEADNGTNYDELPLRDVIELNEKESAALTIDESSTEEGDLKTRKTIKERTTKLIAAKDYSTRTNIYNRERSSQVNLQNTSVPAHKFVRTDYKLQRIDAFFNTAKSDTRPNILTKSTPSPEPALLLPPVQEDSSLSAEDNDLKSDESAEFVCAEVGSYPVAKTLMSISHGVGSCDCCDVTVAQDEIYDSNSGDHSASKVNQPSRSLGETINNLKFIPGDYTHSTCQYTSILELQKEISDVQHPSLQAILKQNVFVGVVNSSFSIIQHQTKLILVNHSNLARHLFYQLAIKRFGCFPRLDIAKPISIIDLIYDALSLQSVPLSEIDIRSEAITLAEILTDRGPMLDEYFSIRINENGLLSSLPDILPLTARGSTPNSSVAYFPPTEGLPTFLLQLATRVDWKSEKQCFQSISEELAIYYASLSVLSGAEEKDEHESFSETVKTMFYPSFVKHLTVPKQCADDNTFQQIATLEQLYRVFERC